MFNVFILCRNVKLSCVYWNISLRYNSHLHSSAIHCFLVVNTPIVSLFSISQTKHRIKTCGSARSAPRQLPVYVQLVPLHPPPVTQAEDKFAILWNCSLVPVLSKYYKFNFTLCQKFILKAWNLTQRQKMFGQKWTRRPWHKFDNGLTTVSFIMSLRNRMHISFGKSSTVCIKQRRLITKPYWWNSW